MSFKSFSTAINLIPFLFFLGFTMFAKPKIEKLNNRNDKNAVTAKPISEEKFVIINGIEQWITIKGESTKPAILFIHGGPGSPISPYSDSLFKTWQKDFIIIQWDQRGTGKTYGLTAPDELTPEYLKSNPLTIHQMTDDGIKLTEYILKHLGKRKIILFGTSWGSALGVKIATKRPDLFYAYVGHSQIVNPAINEIFYNKFYNIAVAKNDSEAIKTLTTIGKPPYERAKSFGQLFRIVKKFEGANSNPAPSEWFIVSPPYDNEKDNQNRENGDDYSFVNYVGDAKLGVEAMNTKIDLMSDNFNFKIPVYLIQGNEDLLTPKASTEKYFNKLKAPKKKYYLLPNTAHGFNLAVLETQYKIFKSIKAL